MTIRIALTPDGRWDATATELAEAASTAGFAALGVSADRADTGLRADYRRAGLDCHEILALVLSDDAEETISSARSLAQAAQTMAAEWVLTVFRSPLTPITAPIIERCATMFAEAGAGMAVEFSPLGPVTSIAMGMEIVEVANRGGGRGGLMIDSWHFCFGDSTWADLEGVAPSDIAYVQFDDALAPESDKLGRETMNRRAAPGEGVLELSRFADTLRSGGFDGTVSVEVLSAELRSQPVGDVARHLYETTIPYWV